MEYWGLYLGLNTAIQKFVEWLNDHNRYLLYFPVENAKLFDQNEIIEIFDHTKTIRCLNSPNPASLPEDDKKRVSVIPLV
jgi:hypothetical protein